MFLYAIATYHWKGFEYNYNFVGGNISIIINMQKLQSKKIIEHICSSWKLKLLSPRDMIVFQGKNYLNCSPKQFKFLFHKDMIILQEKKSLSCSPRQLKFLFPKDMIVPRGKTNFLITMNYLEEKFKFPMETYVSKFLAIRVIS